MENGLNGQGAGDQALEDSLRGLVLSNNAIHVESQLASSPSLGDATNKRQPSRDCKRPNQAQRRQINAQLSIPMEAARRPYQQRQYLERTPSHRNQQYSQGRGSYPAQVPRPAGFGLPHQADHEPNDPSGGQPFSPPPRCVQSQAQHRPAMFPFVPLDLGQPEHLSSNGSFTVSRVDFSARVSRHGHSKLLNPYRGDQENTPDAMRVQSHFLTELCSNMMDGAAIEVADIAEKEHFRIRLEQIAREAISTFERQRNGVENFPPMSVQLRCFGSLASGFATKASDMDLGLLSPWSAVQPDAPGSHIPRLVEKAFLDAGFGARLLTRTRVPIIKVCEKPAEKLRLDLGRARQKWERGVDDDAEDDDGPEDDATSVEADTALGFGQLLGPEPGPGSDREPTATAPQHKIRKGTKTAAKGQFVQKAEPKAAMAQKVADGQENLVAESSLSLEQKVANLKQGNKSMERYCGMSKSLLRKLGGGELCQANMYDLNPQEADLLNRFCLAFVSGLKNVDLRKRLMANKSFWLSPSSACRRSFVCTAIQVEGEELLMAWDSRKLTEKDTVQEERAARLVRNWQGLQHDLPLSEEQPMRFFQETQALLEQLKKLPSLQLPHLSQDRHESASAYLSRTRQLLCELGGRERPVENNRIQSVVTHCYVSGIYGEKMHEDVQRFATTIEPATLQAVACKHKCLQLAVGFEKALQSGLYPQCAAQVERYIELLRAPMHQQGAEYYVPVEQEHQELLSTIQQLPHPLKLAPNQARDPYADHLAFPKEGAGVQCDINFSAHLALQNTTLLRCYSRTDPRVTPLVLFIKHWASVRDINTPYRGTLSSYGYVLMMLHYLVNVARPFVCPNLQELAPQPSPHLSRAQYEETVSCRGNNVQFWRDEGEISRLAANNALNQNTDSIGYLLRGFFEYYGQTGPMSTFEGKGFDWVRDVISLRTHGGLLSKPLKGWTGAKTVVEVNQTAAPAPTDDNAQPSGLGRDTRTMPCPGTTGNNNRTTREVKEVRHRYLFAIEDPFELDHNVARTVTHKGIVAIRNEFRRAWRIIRNPSRVREDLLENAAKAEQRSDQEEFLGLLSELHGKLPAATSSS